MSIFSTIQKAWSNFWIQRDGSEELENLTHVGTFGFPPPRDFSAGADILHSDRSSENGKYFWNPVFSYPYGLTDANKKCVDNIVEHYHAACVAISQLKFLLSQAPRHLAPVDKFRKEATQIAFAYIHPKTLAALEVAPYTAMRAKPKSGTQWVPVSLVPEGQVIYSPNPIPGLEKILGR